MPQYKKLGNEPIRKLLFKQSLPAMIGLLVLSLYNFVDAIFIGRGVGSLGIASLAIVFPIQMIFMSFSHAIGIGISSIISRSLGAKKPAKAELALGNFFSLSLIVGISLTIFAWLLKIPLLKLFGATPTILPFASNYLTIIIFGTVFLTISAASNHIIRSEGNSKYAMFVMITGAVINIILDPIFIFGMNMGMKGAALATVIGQFVSFILALIYFFKGRSDVKLKLHNMKLDKPIVKETMKIGSSSLARNASSNVISILFNHSLGFYGGDLAIAAYGIINRLAMFTLMPLFGLIQGMQPILGFNYGAKNFLRVKEVIKEAMKYSTLMAFGAFIVLMLFSRQLISMFTTDTSLIGLTTPALRIVMLMIPLIGFQIVAGGMYQSMGQAKKAFFISIMRQTLFLIPFILILPKVIGLKGIFLTLPISDLLAAIVTFFIVKKEFKKLRCSK